MNKLLQEQIDQLRREVCFLARHLSRQQTVVDQLLMRAENETTEGAEDICRETALSPRVNVAAVGDSPRRASKDIDSGSDPILGANHSPRRSSE